ncbi:MAG: hypothetical protein M0P29_14025 [Sphaerochaetaceae bacterium]|nr:hypothetical protein [Sphaerochaetaceae bacterium]
MMSEIFKTAKLHGELAIKHTRDDIILNVRYLKNLVVDAGKAQIAGLINGATSGTFDQLAIGTGTTAPAATDTELETEITDGGGARATATTSRVTTDVSNDTAQWVHQWTFTGTKAVTESGIFDATEAGNMLARQTFSVINVQSGDKLEITWKCDID